MAIPDSGSTTEGAKVALLPCATVRLCQPLDFTLPYYPAISPLPTSRPPSTPISSKAAALVASRFPPLHQDGRTPHSLEPSSLSLPEEASLTTVLPGRPTLVASSSFRRPDPQQPQHQLLHHRPARSPSLPLVEHSILYRRRPSQTVAYHSTP